MTIAVAEKFRGSNFHEPNKKIWLQGQPLGQDKCPVDL